MNIYFQNNYSSTVWLAVAFYSPESCREYGDWATRGWFRIDPGNRSLAIITNNRYAYFFAETDNGAIWEGNYFNVYLAYRRFESCVGIGVDPVYKIVGMREVDTSNRDHTVNLIGPNDPKVQEAIDANQYESPQILRSVRVEVTPRISLPVAHEDRAMLSTRQQSRVRDRG